MVAKNFRVWAWARRPSPTGPNVVAATVATMRGREGNDRRGQDRRYQKGSGDEASVASISRDTGVSEPTVRKYLRESDLSERPPAVGRALESPLLEPFAELIDSWLLEDRRCWFKQRHTAKRVYDRLVGEKGFEGSYTTVQRYVKCRREELACCQLQSQNLNRGLKALPLVLRASRA